MMVTGVTGAADAPCGALVEKIDEWTVALGIPRLGAYGVRARDVERIIEATGMKNNPVPLGPGEMREILLERI